LSVDTPDVQETRTPLVTVVTPVFNGDQYLAQCIESVLAQDYSNWEYLIVNNRSTDNSLAIAQSYARRDPRIKVFTNEVFVNAEENHNTAFRLVPPSAVYCKVVSADDWLLPHCLSRLVGLAQRHPSIGILGSYQRCGDELLWTGLAENVTVLSGREMGRLGLLHSVHVFGNPTSSLYRADVLRRTNAFFPHSEAHADTSACYAVLHDCDYGFVHEALSVKRVHEEQISSRLPLNHRLVAYLDLLTQYGPLYLTDEELSARINQRLTEYYRLMGTCVWKAMGAEFWDFHQTQMRELGYPLDVRRLAWSAARAAGRVILNPRLAASGVSAMFARYRRSLFT
jgi:glycosyltransferase involved in cell wall biosynthesis